RFTTYSPAAMTGAAPGAVLAAFGAEAGAGGGVADAARPVRSTTGAPAGSPGWDAQAASAMAAATSETPRVMLCRPPLARSAPGRARFAPGFPGRCARSAAAA